MAEDEKAEEREDDVDAVDDAAKPEYGPTEFESDLADAADAVDEDDEPEELTEAQSVAAKVAVARPTRKVEAKGKPTTKQSKAAPDTKKARTTPAQFVGQCVQELKKVIWPTISQWQQYFWVVLIFVVFIIAFVSGIDLGFGWLLLRIFG
ncbi:MAG: preprotein translocase subunit SecE [Propionibacteriaceae bacterium]|jgi:preprotein translocase subunit SecE|nr:preprotein translocase subunit SecE [Propionibacteriaceae bacterium]